MSTICLTAKQNQKLKSPIQDINHCLNQVYPAFNFINPKLRLGFCIVNLFPDYLFFFPVKCSDNTARRNHLIKLDNILQVSARQAQTIIIVTDAGAKSEYHAIFIVYR